MIHVNKYIFALLVLFSVSLYAQDAQQIYDEAKSELLQGNYESALLKITIGYALIEEDPNLDPNGNFTKQLFPKLENTANQMSSIVEALDEINRQSHIRFSSVDDSAGMGNINIYAELARDISSTIIAGRDSILSQYELDPEYLVGLQKNPVYKYMDSYVTQGIMDSLSQKYIAIGETLTGRLNLLNDNFKKLSAELSKLKKSASAGRAEKQKLENELEKISQERMNYLNTISEMLVGQASPENPQLQSQFLDNNVEGIFTELIRTEIDRIQGLSEVDSATYRELMFNYERISSYNAIFMKNNISSDQSELVDQYERAIKRISVIETQRFNPVIIGSIVAGILLILILVFILSRSKGSSKSTMTKPPSAPPVESKE